MIGDQRSASTAAERYSVGGVMFDQPFKIRRLGHFGLWCRDVAAARDFYADLLGFRVTDEMTFTLKDGRQFQQVFTSHSTDHHSLVLGDAAVSESQNESYADGVTLNQLSFQVGSLREVVDGQAFFGRRGIPMNRTGRDAPGSNWAVYAYDPDGNRVELFYGMEQIGWDGRSKPAALRYLGSMTAPGLPQPSEVDELRDARDAREIDLSGGIAFGGPEPATYDVGGIMLPRPFRVTGLGPVHLFVRDLVATEKFYVTELGFVRTEEVMFGSHRGVFLRHGTDHHMVGLFDAALRDTLGLNPATNVMSIGIALGSYDQLRDAATYLKERGVASVDAIPPELHPGIDHAAHFLDPEGHCLRLYVDIEQIGWDGRPRPAAERPAGNGRLPDTMDAKSDSYSGQCFFGPIG